MNDSLDSDKQINQNESIEEMPSSKRIKNTREAYKKAQKKIDDIVYDEEIMDTPSGLNDKRQQRASLIHQPSFIAPSNNYRPTSFSSINRYKQNYSYLNFGNFCTKIGEKNAKEGVLIDQSNDMHEFINIGLKAYLKNSLEKLIHINRRRESILFPNSAYRKKIGIQSYDSKSEITNTKPFQKRIEFIPYKKFNIYYTRNINRNIQFIERYKQLLAKEKEKDNNNNNTDLRQDQPLKKDESEIQEIDCVIYNNYDITRNIKLNNNKKRLIELKDLIKFLEEENKTPLQKILLHKAYILLTTPKS